MEKPELSYKDAMKLLQIDPKNTAIHPVLRRLNPVIQDMVGKANVYMAHLNRISSPKSLTANTAVIKKQNRQVEKVNIDMTM